MVMSAEILLESGDQHCPEVPNAESATRRPICEAFDQIRAAKPAAMRRL